MYIYADNAATTKMSRSAIDEMIRYMENDYANPSSLYSIAQKSKTLLEDARGRIKKAVNAEKADLYFTSGGSESDNMALFTAAEIGERQGKKHIVTTSFEHHAVLHALDKLKQRGFEISLLPVYENGIVRVEDVEGLIREDTVLVSVMFVNNEIGTIQPIREIGVVCKDRGVLFHTDAVQALGHIPVDFEELNVDMLSLSAHKFHGPKGIGALIAGKKVNVINLIFGGGQENGKRAGTENVGAILSMAAALEEAIANMESNNKHVEKMRDLLESKLLEIEHSIVNGDKERRVAGTLNMCFEGIEGESLLLLLDDKGIAASSGSACTSGSLDPSHVLLAIGRPHEIAHGSLRLSLGEEISEEEVEYMAEAVADVVAYLRKMSPVWRDLKEGKRNYVI